LHTIIASGVGKSKLLRYVCTASSPFFHLEGQVCLWKIRFFPEKMSDFTETPHFNHNSVKGSHYTVIIKKKKRQQKRKKAKRKAPVIPPGDGSFREFLRYKD